MPSRARLAVHTAQMEDALGQRRQAYEAMQRALRAEAALQREAASWAAPTDAESRCGGDADRTLFDTV